MGATHSTNVNSHSHSRNTSNHSTNTSRQCGASDRLAVSNLRSQLTTIYRNHEDEEEEDEDDKEEEEERRFALVRDFDLSSLKRIRVPRRNHILMDPHKKVPPLFILSPHGSLVDFFRFKIENFRFCCFMSPTTLEGIIVLGFIIQLYWYFDCFNEIVKKNASLSLMIWYMICQMFDFNVFML